MRAFAWRPRQVFGLMGAALESASIYWVPLPRSERTQGSRRRSFPITAAGQLRISLVETHRIPY